MLLPPRGLYSPSAPEPRSREGNIPTLLFSWWCTIFALTIIGVRLFGRMVRNNQLFKEDKIMAFAVMPLMVRMALVHVILIWGTNNVDTSKGLSDMDIYHRSIGSKLVLASRIFYAMFIWTAKLTVSEFLKRLTSNFWKREYEIALQIIRWFLILAFIAVVIATLAECQPFDHYWQVVPDPGPQCRQGYTQLITMGTADMITDVLLIVFPIPIVMNSSAFHIKRKVQLILLFSMSAVLVGVTGYRIKSVIAHAGRQQYRSVFASGEILAAAAVSNAVIIGSFLRDKGVKRQRYRHNSSSASTSGPTPTRRTTMTALNDNDSDSDLFRDMCYRTAPELEEQPKPRPPPLADPELALPAVATRGDGSAREEEYFVDSTLGSSRPSQESRSMTAVESGNPAASLQEAKSDEPKRIRTVSFYDMGGLLEGGSSRSSTIAASPSTTTSAQDFSSPTSARRGSRSMLSDLGGLLSPILSSRRAPLEEAIEETSNPPSPHPQAAMMTPVPSATFNLNTPSYNTSQNLQSLQDIGGLLDDPPSPNVSPKTIRTSRKPVQSTKQPLPLSTTTSAENPPSSQRQQPQTSPRWQFSTKGEIISTQTPRTPDPP